MFATTFEDVLDQGETTVDLKTQHSSEFVAVGLVKNRKIEQSCLSDSHFICKKKLISEAIIRHLSLLD